MASPLTLGAITHKLNGILSPISPVVICDFFFYLEVHEEHSLTIWLPEMVPPNAGHVRSFILVFHCQGLTSGVGNTACPLCVKPRIPSQALLGWCTGERQGDQMFTKSS